MKAMRRLLFLSSIGPLAFMLTACSAKVPTMTPELQAQLIDSMRNGQAVLDCNLACAGTWGASLQELQLRYATQDWTGLGTLVMQIGFQNDLAYYYLGRASEGLGADAAALRYYQIAGAIATAPGVGHKCNSAYNLCNGLRFPQALFPRIQTVSANLQRQQQPQQPPPLRTATRSAPQPVAAPARAADENWITPPPVTR